MVSTLSQSLGLSPSPNFAPYARLPGRRSLGSFPGSPEYSLIMFSARALRFDGH